MRLHRIPAHAIVGLVFTCFAAVQAVEPPGYYSAVEGTSGAAFRAALHQVIRAHTVIPYSSSSFDTHDALALIDQDPADTTSVILVYGSGSRAKTLFGSGTGKWDREHLWPNSYGIDSVHPMYSDLFNLRPCDSNVNSDRNNNYYDESNPSASGYERPAHVNATLCSEMSNISWEPPESIKGDIARSMFYVDVRYEGDAGEANLELTDNTALILSTSTFMGKLSTLLVWHFIDPVDDAERARNDLIYAAYQHNRNPFIDHPEWVEAIYGAFFKMNAIGSTGAFLDLRWPAAVPAEMSDVLSSGNLVNWSTLTATPQIVGSEKRLLIPLTTTSPFFRLRLRAHDG